MYESAWRYFIALGFVAAVAVTAVVIFAGGPTTHDTFLKACWTFIGVCLTATLINLIAAGRNLSKIR